jgi:hypothetical protein
MKDEVLHPDRHKVENLSLIEKLPESIRQQWESLFDSLATAPGIFYMQELDRLGFSDYLNTMNPGHYVFIFLHFRQWRVGMELLIKEEFLGEKYKIPLKKRFLEKYEYFGKLLIALFHLVERCHTLSRYLKPGTLVYNDASETLSEYFLEEKKDGIRSILTRPHYNIDAVKPNTLVGKANIIKRGNPRLKALSQKQNPYNSSIDTQKERYRLIDAAIQLTEKFGAFKEDYWNTYVKAEREWWEYQKKNCQDYWIETDRQGNFWVVTNLGGRGRGKDRLLIHQHPRVKSHN